MKRILLAGMIAALALGPAMAQETCATKAVAEIVLEMDSVGEIKRFLFEQVRELGMVELLALDQVGHMSHQYGCLLRLAHDHMVDRIVGRIDIADGADLG